MHSNIKLLTKVRTEQLIELSLKRYIVFTLRFYFFFKMQKRNFLRFYELLYTCSRTLVGSRLNTTSDVQF